MRQIKVDPEGVKATLELPVYAMTGDGCAAAVKLGLSGLEGFQPVDVDLPQRKVRILGWKTFEAAAIRARVEELGRAGPSWREFLRAHAKAPLAGDTILTK